MSLVKILYDDLGMNRCIFICIFVYVCAYTCTMHPGQSQMTDPPYPFKQESAKVIERE